MKSSTSIFIYQPKKKFLENFSFHGAQSTSEPNSKCSHFIDMAAKSAIATVGHIIKKGYRWFPRHFSNYLGKCLFKLSSFLGKQRKKSPKITSTTTKKSLYKQTILHFCPKNNNRKFLPMYIKVNSRSKNREFSVSLLVQTLKRNLWSRKNTQEQLAESSLIF